jgi:hypothetical protein
MLRPHIPAVVDEIAEEIRRQVPAYAHPADSVQGRQMVHTISLTVQNFVSSMDGTVPDWTPLIETYARLGAREAGQGHGLEGLEAALRLSSQIACRRFIKEAYRLDWPHNTLTMLTESLFLLLGRLVEAAAEGYAAARHDLATERERHRDRLRDLLVCDPPASREAIKELSRIAGWDTPDTLCVVALRQPVGTTARLLPPTVLADRSGDRPYLLVPDPEGPGQERLLAALTGGGPGAAIGPTVPVERGAVSLRWARQAMALMDDGVLPKGGPLRCVEHLATLIAFVGHDLVDAATPLYLRPLLEEPSPRREILAETLLSYFNSGGNAVTTSQHLHIHPQTVRYRIRVIQELFGGELPSPETKLATMITLNSMLRLTGASADDSPE